MSTIHEHAERARDGIHAHALLALATHIADHHLPTPTSIDSHHRTPGWTVFIPGAGAQAWINSLVVDDENNEIAPTPFPGERYYKTTWKVRLPSNGCRFTLVAFRAQPFLEVVTA